MDIKIEKGIKVRITNRHHVIFLFQSNAIVQVHTLRMTSPEDYIEDERWDVVKMYKGFYIRRSRVDFSLGTFMAIGSVWNGEYKWIQELNNKNK